MQPGKEYKKVFSGLFFWLNSIFFENLQVLEFLFGLKSRHNFATS